jgi:IrrE N-terminal-like domain
VTPEPERDAARVDVEGLEARAEEVLATVPAWIWDGETLPVPVEEITDSCFSLLVRDVAPDEMSRLPGAPPLDPGQAVSGLLLASRGEIWVNADEAREWPGRRRFTICHELGHWRLHRTGQESLFCRSATVAPEERDADPATTEPPVPITEEEANVFAAALLMPARLIREHYPRLRDHAEMCELFGTSGAAMGKRLYAVIESGD